MSTSTVGPTRSDGQQSLPLPVGLAVPAAEADTERAVLGALLLLGDPRHVLEMVKRGLRAEHFFWERHAQMFAAANNLAARREPIDSITLHAELERVAGVGSFKEDEIDVVASYVPAAGNKLAYADRVIELARWRRRKAVALEMLSAVEERDAAAWDGITEVFRPSPETQPSNGNGNGNGNGRPLLHLVDRKTGEVLEENHECERCQELEDQLKGAEKEIRGWRARYADLSRDKEADARADGMWQTAQRLFEIWKKKTGHARSPFTGDRFYECAPYLRNKKYGPEVVERAIEGIAFDPYVTVRKNGTTKRHDGWDLLFRSSDKFEEYVNRAPKEWKPTLVVPKAQPKASGKAQAGLPQQPRLIAVEKGA